MSNLFRQSMVALGLAAVMAAAPLNSTMAAGDFKLFGKTYGDWSAAWWQWQERFYPEFGFGEGSVDCRLGQRGPVWFLGGTGGGEAERTCNRPIPRYVRLFIPLVNAADFDDEESCDQQPCSVAEQRELLDGLFSAEPAGILGSVGCQLQISVDDQPAVFATPIVRTQSPPFHYAGNPENVADGFWVMLPRLKRGDHTINFTGGLCAVGSGDPLFAVDVTYNLTVR